MTTPQENTPKALPTIRGFAALLPGIGVRRPVTTIMTLLALMIIGVIAYLQIPLLLFPRGYEMPFLYIYTPYRGSTPQEVERQISRPIEEMLRTVSGIRNVRSYSSQNMSSINVDFHKDVDMDVAFADVRDRLDRVLGDLPQDVERINMWKYNTDDQPIHFFVIEVDADDPDLYMMLDQHISKALMRVDGVARAEIFGVEEKVVQLAIDQDRMRANRVQTYEMIQKLQNDNFALSSGYIYDGSKKMYVRSLAKFRSVAEIERVPIKGANTTIRDVGNILYEVPEKRWVARVNRNPGVGVQVLQESQANTVEVCHNINAALDEMFATNPVLAGMNYKVILDTGSYIEEAIENLQSTGMWGGLFAFVVLFGFLRRVRITMVIALAIPLCLLVTISALYFMGWSLNLLTLMGLMLCVGMVVDNAIVIMENVLRRRVEGHSPTDSALTGASEMGLAITMSTLTSIVVFLPVILMEGSESDFAFFMLRIGLPVIVALLASLWMALLFIPFSLTALKGTLPRSEPKIVSYLKKHYHRLLVWTLHHRLDATILFMALLFSMGIPMNAIQQTDQSQGHINDINIRLELPRHFSWEQTDRVVQHYEEYIDQRRELYRVNTLWADYRKDYADVQLFLNPVDDKTWWKHAYREMRSLINMPVDTLYTRDQVIEDIKDHAPRFAGVKFRVGHNREDKEEEKQVTVRLYGDDTETLMGLSDEVERRMSNMSNLVSVESSMERSGDEVQILINRELAQQYNVDPMTTAQTVSYLVRGIDLPDFHADDREIDVRIGLRKADRESVEQLRNFYVSSRKGEDVSLSSFTDLRIRKQMGTIRRENGKTYMRVTSTTTTKDMMVMATELEAAMQGFEMPRGYFWERGQRFDNIAEQNESQIFAGILAITFVFFLMGVLFESFILPLSVVICIPFAFVGGIWTLFITNTVMDFMVGIGGIILIGIIVNNAIVLVDLINRIRAEGVSREEALIIAGEKRFRPIMMTAMTTICGLLPMAIGGAGLIGIPYAPMGRIMIGGLLSGTFFTPLVVPLAYTYLDDLRTNWQRMMAGLRRLA
jgi:hydrophobic/amphiphilic exporter-1 (mainly G- bacteria), HAE1 family